MKITCCRQRVWPIAEAKSLSWWGARCAKCGRSWLWGGTLWIYVGHMSTFEKLAKLAGKGVS